jgi:aminocarboxymuconate-semialdehyde decarboxylase
MDHDEPMTGAIDLHCHLIPDAESSLAYLPMQFGTGVDRELTYYRGVSVGPIRSELTDVDAAVAKMDRIALSRRALSVAPLSYRYDLDGAECVRWHRGLNDALASACARYPQRLTAVGIVPLQDPAAAAGEARRAVHELGMRGLEIGTRVVDRQLDDPALEPFWDAVEELGIALFIHPEHGPDPLWSDYYLVNLIGNPVHTTVAVASLIFGGVLDRHPGLRFWLAHGGGVAPWLAGRLTHGWRVRPEPRRRGAGNPWEIHSRNVWFDSLTHDPGTPAALISRFGPDRVVLGSDSPFDMQEADPWTSLCRAAPDARDRQRVLQASERLLL